MEKTLWENEKIRVWKIEGSLSYLEMGIVEPEGVDHSLRMGFGPRAYKRGTMYGNPSFHDTLDTFHGSIRYKRLTVTTPDMRDVTLRDVMAVKKFRDFLSWGNRCSLYLISAKSPGETILILALKTGNQGIHDLDGVGSMVDTAVSSLKRHLKYIAIPAVLSFCFIFGILAAFVGAFFGIAGVFGMGIIFFLILPLLITGLYFFKRKLYQFPSREVLRDVLEQESFSISPNRIL